MQKNAPEQTQKHENKQEVSEKPQEKKTNKIKDHEDAPAKRTRKKQKIAH